MTGCVTEVDGRSRPDQPRDWSWPGQQRADLPAAQSQGGLTLDGLRPAYARPERHALIDQRLQGAVTAELAPLMHYGHRYARRLPGLPVSPDPRPFV